jgi:hypothetical protein
MDFTLISRQWKVYALRLAGFTIIIAAINAVMFKGAPRLSGGNPTEGARLPECSGGQPRAKKVAIVGQFIFLRCGLRWRP